MSLATSLILLTCLSDAFTCADSTVCRVCAQERRETGAEASYDAAGAAGGFWRVCGALRGAGGSRGHASVCRKIGAVLDMLKVHMLKLCSVELPRALGRLHLLAKPVKHAAIRQLRQERRRPHTPAIVSGPAHAQKIHAKGSSQCMERTKRAAEGRHSETPAAVRSIAVLVSASISSYATSTTRWTRCSR